MNGTNNNQHPHQSTFSSSNQVLRCANPDCGPGNPHRLGQPGRVLVGGVKAIGEMSGRGYWEQEIKCNRCKCITVIRMHSDLKIELLLKERTSYAANNQP